MRPAWAASSLPRGEGPCPWVGSAATPPSGLSSSTATAATAPLRSEAGSRGSRSGMCAPTVNINIAKPTSLRNTTVGSVGSTASRPVRPTITPARISPITTGTNALRPAPSSGPAKPARTINASTPKSTVSNYAGPTATRRSCRPASGCVAHGSLSDTERAPGRRHRARDRRHQAHARGCRSSRRSRTSEAWHLRFDSAKDARRAATDVHLHAGSAAGAKS
jgi:hypothetical protein